MNNDIKELLKTLFMLVIGMTVFWGSIHTLMKPMISIFVST